ncbi:hypothetical protein RLEG12_08360 (plasmid) [Rhizobium leguminosarum bv. trifolii CB782]|nr:hypothetical protein RLEG12_08360 [Rhizobium leguminosarum bv. trifolii CB782]
MVDTLASEFHHHVLSALHDISVVTHAAIHFIVAFATIEEVVASATD